MIKSRQLTYKQMYTLFANQIPFEQMLENDKKKREKTVYTFHFPVKHDLLNKYYFFLNTLNFGTCMHLNINIF